MNIEQIAKTCHSVHRAYCTELNIPTQPEWDKVENEHRETVIDSITQILSGKIKSKEDSHNNFVNLKQMNGWVYGEVWDAVEKTNPRLVPFDELSDEHKVKEALFFECVKSFM